MTVNMSKVVSADMDWLMKDTGMSQTELTGRALRLLKLYREAEKSGGKLLRTSKEGAVETLIIL